MGIFDRLSSLLRSNINDLISSAENPEKMLNQILVDMRSQLAKAKQQVAVALAGEERLRDETDAERSPHCGREAPARPDRRGASPVRRLEEARHARRAGRPRRPGQAGAC